MQKKIELTDFSLFVMIAMMYLYSDSKADNLFFYVACIIFTGLNLWNYYKHYRLIVYPNCLTTSYFVFFAYATASMLWAPVAQTAAYKLFIASIGTMIALIIYLDNKKKFIYFFMASSLAGVLLSFKIISNYGATLFSIGGRIKMLNFNSNSIGLMLALSMLSTFLLAYIYEKKKLLLLLPVFGVIILLSGSRKALICALLLILAVYILTSKNSARALIRLAVILVGLFVIYYIVMNVDWAYNSVGVRIESGLFSEDNAQDNNRREMINLALQLFHRSPIIGNGFDTFRVLNGRFDAYCHSNFYELLSDTGIIGVVIYYIRYGCIIGGIRSLKATHGIDKIYILLGLVIILIMCGFEFFAVSYYSVFFQIMYALGFKMIRCATQEEV